MLKKFKKLIIVFVLFLIISIFLVSQNNLITISINEYSHDLVDDKLNDFKIMHLSDLHSKMFGRNQAKLINNTKKINPDIIVITGDLIDSRKKDLDTSLIYVNEVIKDYPVFFVSGNHEHQSGLYEELKDRLISNGVIVLEDEFYLFSKNGTNINIIGLRDYTNRPYNSPHKSATISSFTKMDCINILLTHRPELFMTYVDSNVDLVFAGHAHGGQIRLPFVGGVVSPNQGLFPKYTSGLYNEQNTTMVVSRGLGNSIIPFRVFNRPEIVVVMLRKS